jgi:hypothetical protein
MFDTTFAFFCLSLWSLGSFYVNTNFQTFPEASNLKCKETVRPGEFYKFVVTRSSEGIVRLFLNGYPCQKGAARFLTQTLSPLMTCLHQS